MRVIVRLADTCNLKCRMCRVYKPSHALKEMMSIEILEKILIKLQRSRYHGRRIDEVRLDGNREGLCYPKLAEAVLLTKSYGFNAAIVTNGTLLNEELSQELLKAGLNRICFSVSGICSETYQRFQGYTMPSR